MWESRERRLRLKREEEAERFAAKREADKLGDVVFENDPTTKASDDWTGIYERELTEAVAEDDEVVRQAGQEDFPPVILSYATKSNGGCGKEDMWAIANVLRNNGIASFNGYQVKPGEDWQSKWYGKMPEAKICVLILSKEYFTSKACVRECIEAIIESGKRRIYRCGGSFDACCVSLMRARLWELPSFQSPPNTALPDPACRLGLGRLGAIKPDRKWASLSTPPQSEAGRKSQARARAAHRAQARAASRRQAAVAAALDAAVQRRDKERREMRAQAAVRECTAILAGIGGSRDSVVLRVVLRIQAAFRRREAVKHWCASRLQAQYRRKKAALARRERRRRKESSVAHWGLLKSRLHSLVEAEKRYQRLARQRSRTPSVDPSAPQQRPLVCASLHVGADMEEGSLASLAPVAEVPRAQQQQHYHRQQRWRHRHQQPPPQQQQARSGEQGGEQGGGGGGGGHPAAGPQLVYSANIPIASRCTHVKIFRLPHSSFLDVHILYYTSRKTFQLVLGPKDWAAKGYGALGAPGMDEVRVLMLCEQVCHDLQDSDFDPTVARKVPFFRNLSAEAIESIRQCARVRSYVAGRVVCRQDSYGSEMFFVRKGRLTVTLDGVRIGTIGPDDYFGEMALMCASGKRTCDVTADTACELFELARDNFRELLLRQPRLKDEMLNNREYLWEESDRAMSPVEAEPALASPGRLVEWSQRKASVEQEKQGKQGVPRGSRRKASIINASKIARLESSQNLLRVLPDEK
eukprot:g2691.t1